MIIQLINVNKSFIAQDILKDVNFIINKGEKVSIVGYNGAGKTTLVRLITGNLLPDSGEIIIPKDYSISYLKQNALVGSDKTLYDEIYSSNETIVSLQKDIKDTTLAIEHSSSNSEIESLNNKLHHLQEQYASNNGYMYDSVVTGVINGLGFDDKYIHMTMDKMSGGEKTRVALAKVLVNNPDILILDEPTNHLDIVALSWLEDYLQAFKGTLILISHDRYFLDNVATKTIDIDNGKVTVYHKKFTDYMVEKEKRLSTAIKHYNENQKEIKKQEEVIRKLKSFNREKSVKRARSREKLLAKMDKVEKPHFTDVDMNLKLSPRYESGFRVLDVRNVSKSFGSNTLFSNVSFEITKGDKVALIGRNGTGKSTFFKILNDRITPNSGTYKYGAKVVRAYFDQDHKLLNEGNNLIEEISSVDNNLTDTTIRNILASYLFKGDDVFKQISSLSGGEKSRLTFVKLMLSEANFLMLDEPTNHLDIHSKTVLEKALKNYQGTLFIISHDRYFVNKVCNKILYLNDGSMTLFDGTYSEFVRKGLLTSTEEITVEKDSEAKSKWLSEKQRISEENKIKNEIARIEKRIHKIEKEIALLDLELAKEEVYTNHEKSLEITLEKDVLSKEIDELFVRWTELD